MDANLKLSHSVIPGCYNPNSTDVVNMWFKYIYEQRDFEDGPYTEWDETTRGIPTGDEGAESAEELN